MKLFCLGVIYTCEFDDGAVHVGICPVCADDPLCTCPAQAMVSLHQIMPSTNEFRVRLRNGQRYVLNVASPPIKTPWQQHAAKSNLIEALREAGKGVLNPANLDVKSWVERSKRQSSYLPLFRAVMAELPAGTVLPDLHELSWKVGCSYSTAQRICAVLMREGVLNRRGSRRAVYMKGNQ